MAGFIPFGTLHARLSSLQTKLTSLSEEATSCIRCNSVVSDDVMYRRQGNKRGGHGGWGIAGKDLEVALTVLMSAGGSIHSGVTRLALVFQSDPGAKAGQSMLDEVEEWCEHLASSLMVADKAGACPTLLLFLGKGVRGILLSLLELVAAILKGERELVPSLTGIVWETCKTLSNCPKSNKMALRRQMLEWSLNIKDSIDEFKHMVDDTTEAAEGSGGGGGGDKADGALAKATKQLSLNDGKPCSTGNDDEGGGGGAGGDNDDDFDDFADLDDMEDGYDPKEAAAAGSILELLKTTRSAIKVANDVLAALTENVALEVQGEGGIHKDEDEEKHIPLPLAVKGLHEASSDLATQLYPPLEKNDLVSGLDAYQTQMDVFIDAYRMSAKLFSSPPPPHHAAATATGNEKDAQGALAAAHPQAENILRLANGMLSKERDKVVRAKEAISCLP